MNLGRSSPLRMVTRQVVLCALSVAGCAPLRLPAIDPTGARIFRRDGHTTWATGAPLAGLPEPVFPPAPAVPPCPETVSPRPGVSQPADVGCGATHPGAGPQPPCETPRLPPPAPPAPPPVPPPLGPRVATPLAPQERLLVAPQRLLAPVGSEVVLASGVLGPRGDFLPRQRIEWTLAPDGVGHLVTTSDDDRCWQALWHHTSHRRSASQAVTWSLSQPSVLTRGTFQPTDHVTILRGQSWVSVTSPTEGTTHVSVVAPRTANWDQRRQTATIHWVDAQWLLPPPALVAADQPHTLTTVVQRTSGQPLAGWVVQYELPASEEIGFGYEGQTRVEVPTDEQGRAEVTLEPPHRSAATRVEIKILRPPDADLPQMVVGRGVATVHWSAPDPRVTLTGPERVLVGGTATYHAEIANAGDLVASRVTARATIPANMTFLRSEPPARVLGDRLEWNWEQLSPGESHSLRIHCRADRRAEVRFCVRVQSEDPQGGGPLTAEACVPTVVWSSDLQLQVSGPQTARVGERVEYQIAVRNRGTEPLEDVRIRNRLPAGLELAGQTGQVFERRLPEPLEAGASRSVDVVLVVRGTGRLCQVVEAVAAGGHLATETVCIEASPAVAEPAPGVPPAEDRPPAPLPPAEPDRPALPDPEAYRLTVALQGPPEGRVGDSVTYSLRVTNAGTAPVERLRIVQTYDPALYPQEASQGFDLDALRRGELVWTLPRLEPGSSVHREAKYRCLQATAAARVRVRVEAEPEVRASGETATEIQPGEAPPDLTAPPAGDDPEATVAGELRVSLADTHDPVRLDEITTYIVSIENVRDVSDRQVTMTIFLPAGLEYVRLRGPTPARQLSEDGRTIEVTPISELRPGERLNPFYIEVRGRQIGKHTVRVEVDSLRSARPVEATEDTTVTISG